MGLKVYLQNSPLAIDLDINEASLPTGNISPQKILTHTYRTLRDTNLTTKLKELYAHRCQVCGFHIQLSNNRYYSEAHHIIPLGKPHHGSDVPENIIILCPNHHVMMDYGLIELSIEMLKAPLKHTIDQKSIDYHNTVIFNRNLQS